LLISYGAVDANTSISSVAGKAWTSLIIAIGVIVFVVSVLGLAASYFQNRILLIVYLVLICCIFLMTLIGGSYMLAMRGQEASLVSTGWTHASNGIITGLENQYTCCGLNNVSDTLNPMCPFAFPTGPCMPFLVNALRSNFGALGALAIVLAVLLVLTMFFSFVLTKSFKNMQLQMETRVDDSRTAGRFRV